MISPTPFRLNGQGKPLPTDFPYNGEWLVERRIFLYRPNQNGPVTGMPEITPVHQLNESEWCFGINAITLSRDLGVGSHEIFAHNRRRTLLLVEIDDAAADERRYTFEIGERQASITIQGTSDGPT
jgi:hypothetical protein